MYFIEYSAHTLYEKGPKMGVCTIHDKKRMP